MNRATSRRGPDRPGTAFFLGAALLSAALASPLLAQGGRARLTARVEPAEAPRGAGAEIIIGYEVEKGYWIYAPEQDRDVAVQPTEVKVSSPAVEVAGKPAPVPKPEVKVDKLLNERHRILKGKGEIRQPLVVKRDAAPGEVNVAVSVTYAACNETGCELPKTVPLEASIKITDAPPVEAVPGDGGAAATGAGRQQGRAAFTVKVEPEKAPRGGKFDVVLGYEVEEGYWIYGPEQDEGAAAQPTEIKIASPAVETAGKPAPLPKPAVKVDKLLGETHRILKEKGELRQTLLVKRDAPPGEVKFPLEVTYAACNEIGCFPGTASLEVTVQVTDAPPVEGAVPRDGGAAAEEGRQDPIRGGLLGFLIAMFLGGLFILVMPCTYPMIPLTITFFTKQADARQGSVLPLALAYGAGIILVFIAIGFLFSETIGPFAAHWLVNLVFGILFVVFAFVLFGVFELRLPSSWQQLASRAAGAGGYAGVFVLGAVLVITSFTCTAPILGSLLVFAAQEGNAGKVALGMTTIGLTVAAPFVVLAIIPGKMRGLPRAGEWMHVVKVSLGFVELAAACKFFSNAEIVYRLEILPREIFLVIWAALFLVLGLYLLSVFRLKDEEARGIGGLRMLFGIAAISLSLYCLYGMFYRLDPLMEGPILPPYSAAPLVEGPRGQGVESSAKWTIVEDDLEAGLERAKREGKRALVDFTGHTCVNCRTMERIVFTKPEVAKQLDRYVEVRLHLDAKNIPGETVARHRAYQTKTTDSSGIPTYIIVDPTKPEEVVGRFDGLDLTLGPAFREFLARNAGKEAD